MRLQENSEYKLSRALNTTCYSQKVEPADKLLHISILREKNQKVIFQSQRGILFKSIGIDSENTGGTSQTEVEFVHAVSAGGSVKFLSAV